MLELHTTPTANGYRASIMLEECGLEYRVRAYDLTKGEHLSAEHLALNPVGRVPTLVDDGVAGDRPAVVYGSQAILQYLAEKTGRFLPADPVSRAAAYTWAGVATSDLGPAYSGQFVFGTLAQEKVPSAIQYFERLCLRMLGAVDTRLRASRWLAGEEYTIADMLAYPAAAVSAKRFPGTLDGFPNLGRWAAEVGARPAVQRGMRVPA
jgi:GST-like protein